MKRRLGDVLDFVAVGLWVLACKVEDLLTHRHDSKRRYW